MLPALDHLLLFSLFPLFVLRDRVLHLFAIKIGLVLPQLLILLLLGHSLLIKRGHDLRFEHILLLASTHGLLIFPRLLLLHVHVHQLLILFHFGLLVRHNFLKVVFLVSFDGLHAFLLIGLHSESLNWGHFFKLDCTLFLGYLLSFLDRLCLKSVHLLLVHRRPDLLQYLVPLLFLHHIVLLMLLLRVLHLSYLLLDLRVALCLVHLLANFRILQPPLLDFMDFSQLFFASSLVNLVLDLVSHLLLFGEILLI